MLVTAKGVTDGPCQFVISQAHLEKLNAFFDNRVTFGSSSGLIKQVAAFDNGPIEGEGIADDEFHRFRRNWYARMGWDPNTGEPSEERLRALGLKDLPGL